MGSDSDLPVMQGALDVLTEFGVAHEVRVVSAHRTPDVMYDYARTAADRGLRVIIAGAGGAAHLPGMTASMTSLPVIGVPVPLQQLDGLDSLLSIVQMPDGIPVATVGVGKARNAGLLAVRILGAGDDALRAKLDEHRAALDATVREKDAQFATRPADPSDERFSRTPTGPGAQAPRPRPASAHRASRGSNGSGCGRSPARRTKPWRSLPPTHRPCSAAEHHALAPGEPFERRDAGPLRSSPAAQAPQHPLALRRCSKVLWRRTAREELVEHDVEALALAHQTGCARLPHMSRTARDRSRR